MEINTKNYNLFISDEDSLMIEKEMILEKLEKLLNSLSENQNLLAKESFDSLSIELSLVHEKVIQEINSEHRDKNKVTDVLSFPAQDSIRHGEFEILNSELVLGDIVICHEVCSHQASEHGISYKDEFIHLFVHSLVHLYGYDHELSPEEEVIMEEKEKLILDLL